jgi:dTDP-L-rhamnose 4-epimerase
LSAQVHSSRTRPDYLDSEIELIVGDVRDPTAVERALRGVDAVVHLAAVVGVGQSMYQITDYTTANSVGTAVLLELLSRNPVERLVLGSSMSIYGEGLYRSCDGRDHVDVKRTTQHLASGAWDPTDEQGKPLQALPTPEWKAPALESVYALSKYDQEQLCLIVGRAYKIPVVVLRFFNTYGPRQALSNPYTGVLAIFAARILNGNPPMLYEDGRQLRDFVSVCDVARACRLALECSDAAGEVFNIGSGSPMAIDAVGRELAAALGARIEPLVTRVHRAGDIRHCFADITRARTVLGYNPSQPFQVGLSEFASWVKSQTANDLSAVAQHELAIRGLTSGT